ncbi:MAG: CocE/NonD family hydrolase [Thermoleophilia bacterium]|nr:CocE/NonD family hydrolase [Thermoleophilia bacterium]
MTPEPFPGLSEVTVERDVPARMRDGVTLRADVYRPAGDGPWPTLLMRNPYDKTYAQSGSGYAHPSWWARQGWVVAVQDCRGRFRSEGVFYPFVNEAKDGYDSVEWAARLPGADGRVAMYGFSYPGAAQLLAAAERPPSLVAICPGLTAGQFYEGWTYERGALNLAFAASWAAGLAAYTARTAGDGPEISRLEAVAGSTDWLSHLPLRKPPGLGRADAPYYFDWLEHPTYDDYWRATAIDEDYSRIQVPGLHVGGWYDIFVAGTVRNFRGIAGRQKLLVGPWQHGPWEPLCGGRADAGPRAVNDWQLRFLDEVVKGRVSGVFDAPATVYVLGDGWRDLDAWPPPGARPMEWFLHSGGRANSKYGDGTLSQEAPGDEPPDVFVFDPLAPVASAGGRSCCDDALTPMGPRSQHAAERWGDTLVYTSAPLAEDLDLVGEVEVTLHAASTAVDTDFTAKLCRVDPDGESINLVQGIVRARYRRSLSEPELLTPGRVEEYRLALGPIGARIPAGYRLRLDVSSSDFPHWDRNLNTGGPLGVEGPEGAVVATQTVLHDRARASRVTLPVLR